MNFAPALDPIRPGRSPGLPAGRLRHDAGERWRHIGARARRGSPHSDSFPMICVPRDKLLIEADAYTPAAPNTSPLAIGNLNNPNLIANIERLGLGVDRILPLHRRAVPLLELYAAAGKTLPR